MMRPLAAVLGLTTLLGVVACSTSPLPSRPPGLPPTPVSVTKENPGGDAADPERAALTRLLNEPVGWKRDRFDTLRVPLMDWTKWQRVKIWGHPTRASFRYGDDHYGVIALWYGPSTGESTPEACLARFVGEATPQAEAYGVRIAEVKDIHTEQRVEGERRPIEIKVVDGSIETLMESSDYLGGIASYTTWPGTCLIQGFAVLATKHRDLALQIRERWVTEGVPRLSWERRLTTAPVASDR
jgi:hypothetical protein